MDHGADGVKRTTCLNHQRKPFWLDGGAVGVLLLHGFTGRADEMRPLGDALHAAGYTAYGPTLAGHDGGFPDSLEHLPWQAWLRGAERAFDILYHRAPTVCVVGQSLGGTLGTLLAQSRPVAGLVTMAAPLTIPTWIRAVASAVQPVMPWFYPFGVANLDDARIQAQARSFVPDADFSDPTTRATIQKTARIPVSAIVELGRALPYARRRVPYVATPTLVLQGRHDPVTSATDANLLFGLLGSADKALVWFEASGHLLLEGDEREAVIDAVVRFVQARTPIN
ncbi:MAG: alpha/beta fold hydrolase [Anaerolineae bacterium]|nr:alpha/beta fold hydrolase [Anaerolineae bacterium]